MNKTMQAKCGELANTIQKRIDDEWNIESKTYRPTGTWRDNYEEGFKDCYSELEPVLNKSARALKNLLDDNTSQGFLIEAEQALETLTEILED